MGREGKKKDNIQRAYDAFEAELNAISMDEEALRRALHEALSSARVAELREELIKL